ncbi:hypothetical protein ABI_18930 [Asticcacaulis biprosthecium C19]|uniref:DUF6265 domain-containing protein n=1 Tax=Asticcacaulis biprosthecium C19 TaxID=715226 RepID=F4QL78_9CAUL|nr:DUF6265 family protein [Asticcacaulis biprosthecium]EGF93453.1 hypothetical protein ABI_18930 [Asticcacaulis biprosthecium C19]
MIAVVTAALLAAAAPTPVDFLSGYWLSCDSGREVVEVWSDPRAGLQVGHGVTIENGKASFEQFHIAPYEGGLAYVARPGGGEATVFKLTEATATRAVFSNPAHDFPQVIVYERQGDRLNALIEGDMGGRKQVFSWSYVRADLNAHCPG